MTRRVSRYLVFILASLILTLPGARAFAQSEAGGGVITGVVKDATGLPAPGASILIRAMETGYQRTAITRADGRFQIIAMPVGSYSVEASLSGQAPARRDGVVLTVGATEDVILTLGGAVAAETVTVAAEAALLDLSEAAGSIHIDAKAIAGLPIRGRNFTEFVQLTPGIVQESDRFGLVIAGQRSINSNVAIDGADFNDPVQGNQRGGNESVFFFPQSAVREFQVVRSGAGAEVGRTSAGFVNVVTKSGTNQFHGEAFYFNRNRSLTSADAFGRKLNNRQNQFGASFSGPLRSDKAHFFLAAEQNFLRVPFVVKFQPQAAGVVVPLELQALEGEQHGSNDPTSVFARTDFILTPSQTLNLQYTYSRLKGENFNFDSPQQDVAVTANFTRSTHSHGGKAALVSVFGATTVNELRLQVATDDRLEQPNQLVPATVITGFGTIGGDTGRPRLFESTRYQATDNLSIARGSHQFRIGFDLNINHVRQERESNTLGRYDFTSLANYIRGTISRYRQTLPGFDPLDLIYEGTQKEAGVFVQDKVRVGSHLTLTAGLRWDGQWNSDPKRPNPAFPQTAVIPDDTRMWQPRLGLAWTPGSDASTVLRVSAGVYDARTPANLFQRVSTDNGLTALAVDSRTDPTLLTLLRYPAALTLLPPGLKTPVQRIFGFDPSFQNPRSKQVAFTFERQWFRGMTTSLAYVHADTTDLQRRLDRNLFPPTINAQGTPIFPSTRPNPTIAQLEINESTAKARYDAGIVTVSVRRGRAQMQATYTLAVNKDDDSNERNFSREVTFNPFDLASEYTYSKQDVRHNLNATGLLDLPGKLSLGVILIARSGFPYTAVIGSDQQADGNDDNDRAIINGRAAGRNTFRQPSFFNLDLRLSKRFMVSGQRELQVLAEVFNATRASNLNFANDSISVYGTPAAPVATAGKALFAPSTARFGGPRQVQLGARFTF
jgi:hypothetical protein